MRFFKTSAAIALLGFALTMSSAALADGIATKSSQLPAAARAALKTQIDAYRAAHPEAFDAVKNVKGHTPEVYRQNRNPFLPSASRELRALGAPALLPMLEALAFDAPARGSLTDAEWDALAIGMLEAVGVLRDARSTPVLLAIFEAGATRPAVLSATARAMGRLGGDAELASLTSHTGLSDKLRAHAIEGLGHMRRVESAKHLATLLASPRDDADAEAIATALGTLGSSWAWKTLGPQAAAAGLAARAICAKALVPAFARTTGASARTAMHDAILLVDHPTTVELLKTARSSKNPEAAKAIDALIVRVERQKR